MRNLVLDIKREFSLRLEQKNSWGKNEVREMFNNVCIEILAKDAEDHKTQKELEYGRKYGNLNAVVQAQSSRMTSGSQPIPDQITNKDITGHEDSPMSINSAHGYTEGSAWEERHTREMGDESDRVF